MEVDSSTDAIIMASDQSSSAPVMQYAKHLFGVYKIIIPLLTFTLYTDHLPKIYGCKLSKIWTNMTGPYS